MRIAHAASEVFPYLKTGGLADMVAALSGRARRPRPRGGGVHAGLPSVLEGASAAARGADAQAEDRNGRRLPGRRRLYA
ncbi:MAG: glycogen/starch synthase [Lacunisphaera sp.]